NPEQSSGLNVPLQSIFWALHVAVPLLILFHVQATLKQYVKPPRFSPWFEVGLSGLIGVMTFTPIALMFDSLFAIVDPDDHLALTLTGRLWDEFTGLAPPILVVWAVLNAIPQLRGASPEKGEAQVAEVAVSGLWARVPYDLGRDLVALSAEAHYVRVRTTQGSTLILSSFGRAIEELGDQNGFRIHRSHWVALDHVQAVRRRGQGALCIVSDGTELPVSRTYRVAFRKAVEAARV
ncbi:MAG: LytTR family DNA-binding domain-containing protein, partial [Arenibacterium sp.]